MQCPNCGKMIDRPMPMDIAAWALVVLMGRNRSQAAKILGCSHQTIGRGLAAVARYRPEMMHIRISTNPIDMVEDGQNQGNIEELRQAQRPRKNTVKSWYRSL